MSQAGQIPFTGWCSRKLKAKPGNNASGTSPSIVRRGNGAPPADGGLKLNLKTAEVIVAIGSPSLFKRLRYYGWLKPLFESKDALYPITRIMAVQERMEGGDVPPLLPSQQRAKATRRLKPPLPGPVIAVGTGCEPSPGP